MGNFFLNTYNFFEKRRVLFYITFCLSILITTYFAFQLKFEEDISKILPDNKKVHKLNEVFQNSRFIDKLVIMISVRDTAKTDPDLLASYSDHLEEALKISAQPLINKIDSRIDEELGLNLFKSIQTRLPIYLNEKDYKTIDTLIDPSKLRETLQQNIRTLSSPAGFVLKNMISTDPVGISFIGLKKLKHLQYDESFELYDGHLLTTDNKHLLMFVSPKYPPSNTGKNAVLLSKLDSIIKHADQTAYGAVKTSYFGAAAVSVANARQIRNDSVFTQGLTVFALIVFLGFYFRKKRAPFIILIPVVFGALFSMAAIYFIKGHISVIALGTGSVVLGIAINYSLHVFNHYKHTANIKEVIADLTLPLTIGSFTTIGGFLCLEFVESELLKDLGLFAALSLTGASLCSLIFLPHFIISDKTPLKPSEKHFSWLDKISSYRPEFNKYLILGIFALTILFAYTSKNVGFESEMLNMNFMTNDLKQAEAELNQINRFSLQSIYLVTEGKTLNQALKNNEQINNTIDSLKDQGVIKKYSGVSSLLISDSLQKSRIAYWNRYWSAEKKEQLFAALEKEGSSLGYNSTSFMNFRKMLSADYSLSDTAGNNLFRQQLLGDFISERADKATVVTLLKTEPANQEKIYQTFGDNPDITVLDKQYLTRQLVDIIQKDFSSIAIMSSVLVFVVLLLTYGRIELTLVTFIPMLISWVWILGIMGIFGIQFNIINIIISALIFGLGDDYSLFIMDGLLQEYKTGKKTLSSFKSAIFLSAITTVTGLGVLLFAQHPALRSIALISIIGIICVVMMSQILIPFFFTILIKKRVDNNRPPWTASGFLKTLFAFSYFLLGCILLNIIGLFLIRFNPFNKEKARNAYTRILSSFCRSLMYIMANVKKEVINPHGEDFSKPAIVISNHQSFLDILSLVMLHPKLILFTNEWVWNSPFFGWVVKMAGYFPVSQGVENNLDLLSKKIREGYSIAIFPEGTRSTDGTIKRFHKGAFYLAEQLGIDILPIMIHGTGDTMTKGDFLLKDGRITIRVLPRINKESQQFGSSYSERAKNIGRYFRAGFKQLKYEIEQPGYFKEQLITNYLFKGPVIEWYIKTKLRMEKNYQIFHTLLPQQGKILDLGCGYGFMAYLLHFASPGREFTGVDYDLNKIETAANCFSKDESIDFLHEDALEFQFRNYDAIIIADMLHYLEPAHQKELIEKCFHSLSPGGSVVIREGNTELKNRHKRTVLTEILSTRLFAFNKVRKDKLSFLSASFLQDLSSQHNMEYSIIDSSKYTSNIVFIIKKPHRYGEV